VCVLLRRACSRENGPSSSSSFEKKRHQSTRRKVFSPKLDTLKRDKGEMAAGVISRWFLTPSQCARRNFHFQLNFLVLCCVFSLVAVRPCVTPLISEVCPAHHAPFAQPNRRANFLFGEKKRTWQKTAANNSFWGNLEFSLIDLDSKVLLCVFAFDHHVEKERQPANGPRGQTDQSEVESSDWKRVQLSTAGRVSARIGIRFHQQLHKRDRLVRPF
jgi:hypothetical protein